MLVTRALPSAPNCSCPAYPIYEMASGPQIQWIESYVTEDRIYCVYIAPSEKIIREHARQGGFPADRISKVKAIIDPTTAETDA